jgi:BMFP domain-containing protein YqiC|tara:strand:+ start:1346 stop:1591 length:246 start_codon:yes stop_codon:yes gene_type:complete
MSNSEKLLKMLSSLVENGILTSQDVKKEILTNIKFQKDNLIEKLQVVSREEFEVLKKIVQKQEKQIEKLKRKKITKKAKRS